MSPATFKAIRERAGLSQSGLARVLRLKGDRHIRAIEAGTREAGGPITALMELLDQGKLDISETSK